MDAKTAVRNKKEANPPLVASKTNFIRQQHFFLSALSWIYKACALF